MAVDFREDTLDIFTFGGVIARGFRRRPVIKHHPDRLFLERRIKLQELKWPYIQTARFGNTVSSSHDGLPPFVLRFPLPEEWVQDHKALLTPLRSLDTGIPGRR